MLADSGNRGDWSDEQPTQGKPRVVRPSVYIEAAPLSPERELARVAAVGDRLRSALRDLVETFPNEARSISGMARWLGIPKATCQRVVEGLEPSLDPETVFLRLPGVKGVQQHAKASRKKSADEEKVIAVEAAASEYEDLLEERGGSQRGLVEFVASLRADLKSPSSRPDRQLAASQRRAVFQAARHVTGEEVGVKGVVAIARPDPADPSRLVMTIGSLLAGVKRQRFARPIVATMISGSWGHVPGVDGLRPEDVHAETPTHRVLEEFSTTGLRPVNVGNGDARSLMVVDVESGKGDGLWLGPVNVALVFESRARQVPGDSGHFDVAARISQPTRWLVLDVFLHKSLAEQLGTVAGCYSLAAAPGDTEHGRHEAVWFERFPEAPDLSALGWGLPTMATPGHPRQRELCATVFEKAGVDPSEYFCWRLEVEYPLWQTEYRVYAQRS